MKKAYRASTVYGYGELAKAIRWGFSGILLDGHAGKYHPA
jgi:hypothetical protein